MSNEPKDKTWDKEFFRNVIDEWRIFWMNQTQNNHDDYENYLHRAMGVDANMQYHLARLLSEKADISSHPKVKALISTLEKISNHKNPPMNHSMYEGLAREALENFNKKES